MLTRVLIVMLAVLNMGVALWWWLRPQPDLSLPALAENVAVLELLAPLAQPPAAWADTSFTRQASSITPQISPAEEEELAGESEDEENEMELAFDPNTEDALALAANNEDDVANAEAEITHITPEAAETDTRLGDIAAIVPLEETPLPVLNEAEPEAAAMQPCVSLGPFPETAQVQAALRALGSDVEKFRLREVIVPADTRYRILIPPAPTREQAQAVVERIAAAGFSDYFIINEGQDTHAIALGQFRNQQGAQNRLAQLQAAGFAAQLHTTTEAPHSDWWIDAAPAARVTPATLQQRSNAAQWQMLDCARLR